MEKNYEKIQKIMKKKNIIILIKIKTIMRKKVIYNNNAFN